MFFSVMVVSVGSLNWLDAVSEKNSRVISDELQNICLEHGKLYLFQSDQGDELKGVILCRFMNTKLIYRRLLYEQTWGEIG